jgi:DNA-binding GntR family transcriptional regulator
LKHTSDSGTFERPDTLRGRVEDHLRTAIMEGRLKGGERLREQEICDRLNISRPTLREALRTLEAERLITIEPHRSPTVVRMTEKSASDLYALRQLLEGHAAFQFALLADDAAVERLRQQVLALHDSAAAGDGAGLLRSKQAFYEVLLEGADNQLVKETLLGLLSRINLLRATSFSSPARLGTSLAEIDLLFQKVLARDPEGARTAAHLHIANAKVAALQVLKRQTDAESNKL